MTEPGTTGTFRDRIVKDYEGYRMYDRDGERLGKVEYTVLDRDGQPEYLAVKTGFFGSKATLIPEPIVQLNESNDFEVQATENQVNEAPTFGDEDDIPPDYEDRIRQHYGIGGSSSTAGSGSSTGSGYKDQGSDYDRGSGSGYGDEGSDYGRSEGGSTGSTAAGAAGGAAGGAALGGAAASSSSSGDRERGGSFGGSREGGFDRESGDRGGTGYRGSSGSESGSSGTSVFGGGSGDSGGEKIRVTLRREVARAERVVDDNGEEEVRIRKRMITEETLIDVEDAGSSRG